MTIKGNALSGSGTPIAEVKGAGTYDLCGNCMEKFVQYVDGSNEQA